jgi:hypothetical protein
MIHIPSMIDFSMINPVRSGAPCLKISDDPIISGYPTDYSRTITADGLFLIQENRTEDHLDVRPG